MSDSMKSAPSSIALCTHGNASKPKTLAIRKLEKEEIYHVSLSGLLRYLSIGTSMRNVECTLRLQGQTTNAILKSWYWKVGKSPRRMYTCPQENNYNA